MSAIDQKHNFHLHHCPVVDQRRYYSGCQHRIALLENRQDAGRFPECAAGLERGRCPAKAMMEEEMNAWAEIYYRDRDDCGPGVMKRAEIGASDRTDSDRADHRLLLERLGLQSYAPTVLTQKQVEMLARQRALSGIADASTDKPSKKKQAANSKADPFSGFDLGDLINSELQESAR